MKKEKNNRFNDLTVDDQDQLIDDLDNRVEEVEEKQKKKPKAKSQKLPLIITIIICILLCGIGTGGLVAGDVVEAEKNKEIVKTEVEKQIQTVMTSPPVQEILSAQDVDTEALKDDILSDIEDSLLDKAARNTKTLTDKEIQDLEDRLRELMGKNLNITNINNGDLFDEDSIIREIHNRLGDQYDNSIIDEEWLAEFVTEILLANIEQAIIDILNEQLGIVNADIQTLAEYVDKHINNIYSQLDYLQQQINQLVLDIEDIRTQLDNMVTREEFNLALQQIEDLSTLLAEYQAQNEIRFNYIEQTMNEKFDDLYAKVEKNRLDIEELFKRLADLDAALTASINNLKNEFYDELTNVQVSIESTMGDEITRLDTRIDNSIIKFETELGDVYNDLSAKIDFNTEELYNTINDVKVDINRRVDDESEKAKDNLQAIDDKLTQELIDTDKKLTDEITDLDSKLTDNLNDLDEKTTDNFRDLDSKLTDNVKDLDEKTADNLTNLDEKITDALQELDNTNSKDKTDLQHDTTDRINESNQNNTNNLNQVGGDITNNINNASDDLTNNLNDMGNRLMGNVEDVAGDLTNNLVDLGTDIEETFGTVDDKLTQDIHNSDIKLTGQINEVDKKVQASVTNISESNKTNFASLLNYTNNLQYRTTDNFKSFSAQINQNILRLGDWTRVNLVGGTITEYNADGSVKQVTTTGGFVKNTNDNFTEFSESTQSALDTLAENTRIAFTKLNEALTENGNPVTAKDWDPGTGRLNLMTADLSGSALQTAVANIQSTLSFTYTPYVATAFPTLPEAVPDTSLLAIPEYGGLPLYGLGNYQVDPKATPTDYSGMLTTDANDNPKFTNPVSGGQYQSPEYIAPSFTYDPVENQLLFGYKDYSPNAYYKDVYQADQYATDVYENSGYTKDTYEYSDFNVTQYDDQGRVITAGDALDWERNQAQIEANRTQAKKELAQTIIDQTNRTQAVQDYNTALQNAIDAANEEQAEWIAQHKTDLKNDSIAYAQAKNEYDMAVSNLNIEKVNLANQQQHLEFLQQQKAKLEDKLSKAYDDRTTLNQNIQTVQDKEAEIAANLATITSKQGEISTATSAKNTAKAEMQAQQNIIEENTIKIAAASSTIVSMNLQIDTWTEIKNTNNLSKAACDTRISALDASVAADQAAHAVNQSQLVNERANERQQLINLKAALDASNVQADNAIATCNSNISTANAEIATATTAKNNAVSAKATAQTTYENESKKIARLETDINELTVKNKVLKAEISKLDVKDQYYQASADTIVELEAALADINDKIDTQNTIISDATQAVADATDAYNTAKTKLDEADQQLRTTEAKEHEQVQVDVGTVDDYMPKTSE